MWPNLGKNTFMGVPKTIRICVYHTAAEAFVVL